MTHHPSVMTLLSPLVHTESSVGTDAKLRRLEFVAGVERIAVPVLSGNSIRGLIRRAAARTLLEAVGAEERSLSVEAFDLLHSGGALEPGKSGNDHRIVEAREVREALPPVGLLGASAAGSILAGRVDVHMAIPIVRELEPWTGIASEISVWDIVQEVPYTRRDDRDDRDEISLVQMRYATEVISPGVQLAHGARLRTDDPVLVGCWWDAVERVGRECALGGRGAIGHGRFSWTWEPDREAIEHYREHLVRAADRIAACLGLDRMPV